MLSQSLFHNLAQLDLLWEIFLIGFLFLVGAVVVIIFFFGLSIKETAKNTKGLMFLTLFSVFIPFTVIALSNKTQLLSKATSIIIPNSIEKVKISENSFFISFQTEEPAVAYLKFKDYATNITRPVLPTYSLEKRKNHSFLVENIKKPGGEIYIIINGKQHKSNKTPLELIPEED